MTYQISFYMLNNHRFYFSRTKHIKYPFIAFYYVLWYLLVIFLLWFSCAHSELSSRRHSASVSLDTFFNLLLLMSLSVKSFVYKNNILYRYPSIYIYIIDAPRTIATNDEMIIDNARLSIFIFYTAHLQRKSYAATAATMADRMCLISLPSRGQTNGQIIDIVPVTYLKLYII